MSEVIVISEEPETIDEPTTADLVVDVIDRVVDAITEDDQHDDNIAFVAGVTVAMLDALTGRVETVESSLAYHNDRIGFLEGHISQVATQVDELVVDEMIEDVAEVVDIVEEDVLPPTGRSRFGSWFFS